MANLYVLRGIMPRIVLTSTVLLLALSLASAAIAAPSSDEAAITKIERDMSAAQTAETATANWDKNVVFDDMFPGEVVGLSAVRDDLTKQFAALADLKAEILRIQVKADGKIGFAFSTQHFTGKQKNGGPPLDIVFRQTDCWEKTGGKWLLVHQHLSVPFDPATGKAVFNSK